MPSARAVLALTLSVLASAPALASTCYGRDGNGRLKDGVALPSGGANYSAYSRVGVALGRNYVHAKVRDVVVDAYATVARTAPGKVFVYGETGFKDGGRFRPHRTHQAGLSVDFMVPVLDAAGRSIPLPTHVANKWGYNLEFDKAGRVGDVRIDIDAVAEHLYQLSRIARQHGVSIRQVIFDPAYTERLFETPRGSELRKLPFMKARPWVRHDDHYHIDFAVPCRPLNEYGAT